MAFTQGAVDYRREYNLDDPADRELVRIFEREMEEYESREPLVVMVGTIFEKKLRGFELLLHEKDLFRYSRDYPSGAVVRQNLGYFQDLQMKKRALDNLRYRRKLASDAVAEQHGSLIGQAVDMLGGTVVEKEKSKSS